MKNLKFMSLLLGLMLSSSVFVACGGDDDDDDKKPNDSNNQENVDNQTKPDASITSDKIIGSTWYGIDENSDKKINIFVMMFEPEGRGMYGEFKAKADHNWEVEDQTADMTWVLKNGTLEATVVVPQEGAMTRKGDLLKLDGNTLTVKRYLEDNKTDIITLSRIESPQAVMMILQEMLVGKIDNNQPAAEDSDIKNLTGTWSNENVTYSITDKKLQILSENSVYGEGTITSYKDGILTMDIVEDGQKLVKTALVKFFYDKSIVVLKYLDEEDNFSEQADILYKVGQNADTPSKDIQGTWLWYMHGDKQNIRAAYIIDGDKIELIIVPYSQRMVGKYSYRNGKIYPQFTEFYSGRGQRGDGFGEGAIDEATLACDTWFICNKGDFAFVPEELPFIGNGSEAYAAIVGFSTVFKKSDLKPNYQNSNYIQRVENEY